MSMMDQKLDLTYPCMWSYRIIGSDKKEIEQAGEEILAGRKYTFAFSNASSSGKYYSFNIDVMVESEEERVWIFDSLKNHKNIKMVL